MSAQSGSGKSESFRHAVLTFTEFESEGIADWKTSILPEHSVERDLPENEIKKLMTKAGQKDDPFQREKFKSQREEKKADLPKTE